MNGRFLGLTLASSFAACGGDTAGLDERGPSGAPPSAASDTPGDEVGAHAQHDGGAVSSDVALPPGPITYYEHVKPFMDAKCARCHVEGTVAPFSLDSYALAKQHAESARHSVNAGRMPPWKFDDGCNDYQGDFSLTAEEKALLNAWVDQRMPEGDASKAPPKVDIGEVRLSRVDVTLSLPEAYTPQQRPDEYRCFPVAWPRTETAFMTGFRAAAGDPKIVHHIEVYHVPRAQAATVMGLDERDPGPGYTCFSGPGAGSGTIGGWAPGSQGYDYPGGIGIQIEPGAVIVVQVHYNTSANEPAPDRSKVEMKVDAQAVPGGYNFWTNTAWSVGRQMHIPAGDPDVKHTWTSDPTRLSGGRPLVLYTAGLHMHNLGRTGYMKLKRQRGGEECMIQISDWDFHWQGGVRFKTPIPVNPGDTIEMQCGFDNSGASHHGEPARTPRDVNWGEGTSDEMCLGILLWGPQQ